MVYDFMDEHVSWFGFMILVGSSNSTTLWSYDGSDYRVSAS